MTQLIMPGGCVALRSVLGGYVVLLDGKIMLGLPEVGFSFFGPNGSDIFFCMSSALCMIWNWLGSCGCNSFEAYDTSSTWLKLWLKECLEAYACGTGIFSSSIQ